MRRTPLIRFSGTAISAVAALLLFGCSGGGKIVLECEPRDAIHPICGLHNPEDIAVVEDGASLILSQMGSMIERSSSGNLAVLDLATERVRVVYPVPRSQPLAPTQGWGDPACSGEVLADFNPHGIDLAMRPDGRAQLLVVNHGRRESIELFEVEAQIAVEGEGSTVAVVWRGCVPAADGLFFNDVVSLPDGGMLATHMMFGHPMWGIVRASFGIDTGAVYEWQPGTGWQEIPGSASPFPNGIELSPDARDVYINVYGAGEVWRVSRETGERLASAKIVSPDNSSWALDGKLLVASHTGSMVDSIKCQGLEEGACPLAFAIWALDPETLEGEIIFENEGPPMGAATVAIDLGDELVMGTFAGDRIIRVPR